MLGAAVAQKVVPRQPTAPLAHMLLAAVDEAALYIAMPEPADKPTLKRANR
jgi:hypothetical protein